MYRSSEVTASGRRWFNLSTAFTARSSIGRSCVIAAVVVGVSVVVAIVVVGVAVVVETGCVSLAGAGAGAWGAE